LCMYEETFAPVAPVCAFDKESEAIEQANHSAYGLSAYAFTRDIGRVFRLAESLEAGMIGINDGVPTATQAPFGGVKKSSTDSFKEQGPQAIEFYSRHKTVYLDYSA